MKDTPSQANRIVRISDSHHRIVTLLRYTRGVPARGVVDAGIKAVIRSYMDAIPASAGCSAEEAELQELVNNLLEDNK